MAPDRELDLTKAITAAVAHELWKQGGGNEVVNWLEAERVVASLAVRRTRPVKGRHASEANGRRHRPDRVLGPIPHLG
jgi:hypothetical protein